MIVITGPNAGQHQPWGAWIKPILDMGADGVILPQVRTVAEVEGIVADCRFPPMGRRGRGFLGGHFDYGRVDPDQYMAEADAQIFVSSHALSAVACNRWGYFDGLLVVAGLLQCVHKQPAAIACDLICGLLLI